MSDFDVSRETTAQLETYCDELTRWNKKINLVSPTTISEIWSRHIVDSAQVFSRIPVSASSLVDLGSGGGLPALILAILAKEKRPDLSFTLVESDMRKCAFLRHVSRETNLKVSVVNERIEKVKIDKFDVITARALASLTKLLEFSVDLRHDTTKCIFLKGREFQQEINDAQHDWLFRPEVIQSMTSEESAIVEIGDYRRV